LELLTATWAGHQHSTDILWKSQLLPTFAALLDDALLHEIEFFLYLVESLQMYEAKIIMETTKYRYYIKESRLALFSSCL